MDIQKFTPSAYTATVPLYLHPLVILQVSRELTIMSGKVDPKVFGKWQLTQSENFDAFMSAVGVGYLTR